MSFKMGGFKYRANDFFFVFGGQTVSVILIVSLFTYGVSHQDILSIILSIFVCVTFSAWCVGYIFNRRSLNRGLGIVGEGKYRLSIVNRLLSYPSLFSFFFVSALFGCKMLYTDDGTASWYRRSLTIFIAGGVGLVLYVVESAGAWRIIVTDDCVTLFRYGTVTRISHDSLSCPHGISLQGIVVEGEIVSGRKAIEDPVYCMVDFPLHGWKEDRTFETQVPT